MLSRIILALIVGLYSMGVFADNVPTEPENELLNAINKIQKAAAELDYSGIYTYQQGLKIKASRIVHIVDATGERERVQALDGEPNEYIRHNQDGKNLIPSSKIVIQDIKRVYRFPYITKNNEHKIQENYRFVSKEKSSRVAGRECNLISLQPIDNHRYGYMLCVDSQTDLLLQAQTISDNHDVIDQLMFVSLKIGNDASKNAIDPPWDISKWHVAELTLLSVDLYAQGWRIPYPPGFETVAQISRQIKADRQVYQLVLSDGLAAISIFVEPFDNKLHAINMQGGINKGSVNVYRKRISEFWVTVLGQVPAETVRSIGERVEYVPLVK